MENTVQNTIIECLKYNPNTGVITWVNKRKTEVNEKPAGHLSFNGYLQIGFKGKLYYGHRLAWYLHYGAWPKNHIDHINGIRNDNRIINLRDVTSKDNNFNKKSHRDKTVKHYSFDKSKKVWEVYRHENNKKFRFGYFKTEKLARQFIENNIELINRR
jgi:hypothetical protein